MRFPPWLSAAMLLACSSQPTSSSTPAPQADPVPAEARPMPDASAPASATSSGVSWGQGGQILSTASSVSLHSRVRLQDDPDTPEPIVELGHPIRIVYEKQNTGSRTLTVWHAGFWPNHRVLLIDDKGDPVPPTARGKELAAAFSPQGMRDKNVKWELKPGIVDASEGAYDLTELFEMVPGHYTLGVEYQEELLVVSNSLPFWLVPEGTRSVLSRLNGWDAEECDVAERPNAYPGRVASGETRGFIESYKDELQKLGVTLAWDALAKRYRIQSLGRPR